MNDFEYYLGEGSVKRRSHDLELAKSLINDARDRFEKVSRLDADVFSKIIFENVYDALRDILDAILAIDGYKSYSHEASIAYLKAYGVEISVLMELDAFRQTRNGSKYYGKGIAKSDSDSIVKFYANHAPKLILIATKKMR